MWIPLDLKTIVSALLTVIGGGKEFSAGLHQSIWIVPGVVDWGGRDRSFRYGIEPLSALLQVQVCWRAEIIQPILTLAEYKSAHSYPCWLSVQTSKPDSGHRNSRRARLHQCKKMDTNRDGQLRRIADCHCSHNRYETLRFRPRSLWLARRC